MPICCPQMETWIGTKLPVFFGLINKFAIALFTCIFALGGATIGSITGAIKGQTTETGLSRGFGIGAITGAITGVQLLELIANGEPFSKVALIHSLVNGKIFMEWVSPAVFKAYQWQVSGTETSLRDFSDIFDVHTFDGLSQDAIKELPVCEFYNAENMKPWSKTICAICLQDLKDGEFARLLPNCKHIFHVHCIDGWLTKVGSCPICRKDV